MQESGPSGTPVADGTPVTSAGAAPTGAVAPRHGRFHTDVWVAGVILAISFAIWLGTLTFPHVPAALAQGMGPGLFPALVLAVIALLAVWLALSARSRPDEEREPVHRMVYVTALAILVCMGALLAFGIYGAIVFAVIGIGRLWGERRLLLLLAIALGMIAAIYLVFVKGFGIALPRSLVWLWLN